MDEHGIIALVGPNGAGKRTLITAALKRFHGDDIGILPMNVIARTVSPRDPHAAFESPLPKEYFGKVGGMDLLLGMEGDGDDGVGYDRLALEGLLRARHLVAPMSERAVVDFREHGLHVFTVRVVAMRSPGRAVFPCDTDPLQRSRALRADMTLDNVFTATGLRQSMEHLCYLITMWTGLEPAHP